MAKDKLITCNACGAQIAENAKSCPQCGAKNKKPIYKKWWFWLIIGIILLSSVGGNSTQTVGNATNSGEAKAASATQPTKETVEYTKVSVSQMMTDLKDNAMKAQNTYKNQYLEITGKLNVIDSDGKYISLTPSDELFAIIGVHCSIRDDEQRAQVINMKEDDIVTLRGRCTEASEVLGYTLKIDSIDGYNQGEIAVKEKTDGWIVCDAGTLLAELGENAMKAQVAYKGQDISVFGKLANIDSDGKYISLDPADNSFTIVNIQCFIKTDEVKAAVMDLKIGDLITVKGHCKDVGEVLGYSVDIKTIEK